MSIIDRYERVEAETPLPDDEEMTAAVLSWVAPGALLEASQRAARAADRNESVVPDSVTARSRRSAETLRSMWARATAMVDEFARLTADDF